MKTSGTAIITGASSGIGYELAKLLAAERYDLILVARRKQVLETLALALRGNHGISVHVLEADLAMPGAPEEIIGQLRKNNLAVDVLVNNAGFGVFGKFGETNLQEELALIQVNIVALTHLTKLVLPDMIARKRGRVLNVASTAAFQPGPLMAVYYASKAYVVSFSEAIANELSHTGVTVTCLCPGPTATEFHARAHMMDSRLLIPGRMSAASVARIGYRGMVQGRGIVIPGPLNWILAQAVRAVPRRSAAQIVRGFQERRK